MCQTVDVPAAPLLRLRRAGGGFSMKNRDEGPAPLGPMGQFTPEFNWRNEIWTALGGVTRRSGVKAGGKPV
ncbi:hypothetical protein [uncultured Pelagimonas sp.]|uniref:hypothetical protein n=1 Tax=uncultured Pelagimonas sp. TaxID=1618102 RepID=UPI002616806D|nr:hypothetical protein [uncultured Pelagimonas sp.]